MFQSFSSCEPDVIETQLSTAVAVGLTDARNIYQNDFEQRYLEETEAYYLHESSGMVGTNSISTYMARVIFFLHSLR